MSEKPNVLEEIRKRVDNGDVAVALEELRLLLSRGIKGPDVYRLLALAHLKQGALPNALVALKNARSAGTTALTEVAFGRFLNREGYKEAALNCFETAIRRDPENDDALALICMHHRDAGNTDLATQFGQKCLEVRDRQSEKRPAVPVSRPKMFDPRSPAHNIIAFSLFGESSYYWDCAIANASMAFSIYPEWRCRFYCDPRVPATVRDSLLRLRSQVFIFEHDSEKWSGLFWRFHAFDDPTVNVAMIRDVDSPFSVRERLAVDDWLTSPYPFHAIRDHLYHCEPLMAGLWGGFTGLLPPVRSLVEKFVSQGADRYVDQKFLRLEIWPRIREATLAHDRYFKLGATRPTPHHFTEVCTHIGMSWPRGNHKRSPP